MTVSCPDCRSIFRVDPAKVPATGVRARCSVCGGIIVVSGGSGPMRTTARTPVSAVASGPFAGVPAVPRTPARAMTPPIVPPIPARPATPPVSVLTPGAVTPRTATPAAAPGGVSRLTPAAATPAAATPAALPAPPPVPTPVATPATTPRRAINPFLNADPGQRARRLARALVSDLVAYHPRKREEGLAQGTLRPLFREEIKKSYEEYVEQVGKELAESTPHFQEALNDILAGGQRLF
jgi:predicted Zn finger-like uncharacterized protein